MRARGDTYENVIATLIDFGSIMVAYTLGFRQMNIELGIAYALFDAWMVVWMRKPIAAGISKILSFRDKSRYQTVFTTD
jgi:hypothetical protein